MVEQGIVPDPFGLTPWASHSADLSWAQLFAFLLIIPLDPFDSIIFEHVFINICQSHSRCWWVNKISVKKQIPHKGFGIKWIHQGTKQVGASGLTELKSYETPGQFEKLQHTKMIKASVYSVKISFKGDFIHLFTIFAVRAKSTLVRWKQNTKGLLLIRRQGFWDGVMFLSACVCVCGPVWHPWPLALNAMKTLSPSLGQLKMPSSPFLLRTAGGPEGEKRWWRKTCLSLWRPFSPLRIFWFPLLGIRLYLIMWRYFFKTMLCFNYL